MVLHALEDDHAVAVLGLDDGFLHLEVGARVHLLNLQFKQALDGLSQALLHLAHADRPAGLVHDVRFDHQLGKRMGLARASAAECGFVAGGLQ